MATPAWKLEQMIRARAATTAKHRQDFPEHAKLEQIMDLSQAIGEFLDSHSCCWTPCGKHPSSIQGVLAQHFGIDQDKLEQEKRQMLEVIRRGHDDG